MLVCTCQYIYIRLCRKRTVFLLYPCRSSTVNESIQGSGICEDELRFSPLTHTLQYAGFFFSSSFAFTSKPWKGSHFWPDSLSVFFFLWKCDDVLFISYVRPNPTHDIFVIFGGVWICCMQVATFSWQCENQNSQPSCLCFFFFLHILLRVVNIEGSRESMSALHLWQPIFPLYKIYCNEHLCSTFQRGGCGNVE